jgi:hypothetical protein
MGTIRSGSNNEVAEVDSSNRLLTKATTIESIIQASLNADGYLFNTSLLTLTSDSESCIAYWKNEEDSDVLVKSLTLNVGVSDGTGDIYMNQLINPTAGTVISTATPALLVNTNTTSLNTMEALHYEGTEGSTLTGEAFRITTIHQEGTSDTLEYNVIVRKGGSLGLCLTPPTGNTNMKLTFSALMYLVDAI